MFGFRGKNLDSFSTSKMDVPWRQAVISVEQFSRQDIDEIFVTVNPVNDAPVINSTSPDEVETSIGYEYNIEALDVDGDNIIFSLIGAPENLLFVMEIICPVLAVQMKMHVIMIQMQQYLIIQIVSFQNIFIIAIMNVWKMMIMTEFVIY